MTTIEPLVDHLTENVRIAHAKRAAQRVGAPPELFKRLYIVNVYLTLVFMALIATGACGVLALARTEASHEALVRTIERAAFAPRSPAVAASAHHDAAVLRSLRAAQAADRSVERRLERLVVGITATAAALMGGLIVLLRLYRIAALTTAATAVDLLAQAALTDNLTKLGNQRAFNEDFARERARAARHGHPLALALIDVDDFKQVNDEGGHSHGDEVLRRVGERLRRMRTEDRGYRIGGDEFALILAEANPSAAAAALERLQQELRESLMGATVSIGYVNLSGSNLIAGSYDLADAALYQAKRAGRDRTVCFRQSDTVISHRRGEFSVAEERGSDRSDDRSALRAPRATP